MRMINKGKILKLNIQGNISFRKRWWRNWWSIGVRSTYYL